MTTGDKHLNQTFMQLSEHPFGHVCLDSMLMLLLNGAVLPKAHEDPLLQLTPYPRQTELAHASGGRFQCGS